MHDARRGPGAEMPMNDFDHPRYALRVFLQTLWTILNCAMCSQNPTENNRNDKQSATSQHHNKNKMKLLALISTVLVTTHVAVAVDAAATPAQTPKLKKDKTSNVRAQKQQTQSMVPLPAESRIVGGTFAQPGAYPFFVQGDGCGGSLIANDIVLTAAHCAGAFDGQVYVGPNQQYSTAGGAERITVQAQLAHPSYSSGTEAFDFMLLKLATPVSNPNLKPVALNKLFSNPAPSDVLTVIGFGATSEGGNGSSQLKQVNVDAIAYNTCNQQYGGGIVDAIMLCAGVTGGGKDSCQGDSGGPIVNADGEQVGVVSWGIGCAQAQYPGVYSRVSGALDWIESSACEMSSASPCFCTDSCGTSTGTTQPQQPTSAPIAGDNEVVVTVRHDDYPLETGWTLTDDSSGAVVASQAGESYSTQGGTSVETVNLADGRYTFQMSDSYGDGICCQEGRGQFAVTSNGSTVATGGAFTNSVSNTFDVGGASASTGTGTGAGRSVEYRFDVTYDNYPEETRWFLKQVSTGTTVVEYGFGDVVTPGISFSESIDLIPGQSYRLSLRDTIGDGMCCDYGEGSIVVYATVDGVVEVLTSSDGVFGIRQNQAFTVPQSYARGAQKDDSSSSSSRACIEWLSMNMDRFDYMCEFVDVASICQKTCSSCELFV
jgi:trypsin